MRIYRGGPIIIVATLVTVACGLWRVVLGELIAEITHYCGYHCMKMCKNRVGAFLVSIDRTGKVICKFLTVIIFYKISSSFPVRDVAFVLIA